MKKFNRIGIIGKGFVGSAVAHGFSASTGANYEIKIYDKNPEKSQNSLHETVNESDFIFISVPTPSTSKGTIDLGILDECIASVSEIIAPENKDAIVLLRSTIVPGTARSFQERYNNLNIVFNPEFLTERSAMFDFISQTRIILGGDIEDVRKVGDLYKSRFGETISIVETNFESAELIKYVCNTFFATKVSFLNEMKLLSDNIGADWETVVEGFVRDGRVGNSHTNVPGHDGKLGFGGSCFPKDVQALIEFGKQKNISLNVVKGAWETNLHVRPEKDWENLKGRAVSDDE
ncbi:MAG: NAD(P)-binding domain-containing protein [Gammaproteobacteria bacterium]